MSLLSSILARISVQRVKNHNTLKFECFMTHLPKALPAPSKFSTMEANFSLGYVYFSYYNSLLAKLSGFQLVGVLESYVFERKASLSHSERTRFVIQLNKNMH